MTGGEDWASRMRRAQADRAAARRRHPASGRAQPDRPGMLRAVPAQPDHQPPPTTAAAVTDEENTMTNPADAYLDAMHDQASQRLGHIATTAVKAVMDADGFHWRDHATGAAVARAFREIPPAADFIDGIAQVVCTVYTDHGFPHNPDTVRLAVARHLGDAGPHGDQPGERTSW